MDQDEYNDVARYYDRFTAPFLGGVRRRIRALAASSGAGRVLDLCCGTGRQLMELAREGIPCVGVDASPAMLGVARAALPGDVELLRGDAAALDFADGTFGMTTIAFALHEKPLALAEAILAEAVRVTVPGGLVAVADYRRVAHGGHWLAHGPVALVERAAGAGHYGHYRRFMAAGGAEGFLDRAGLAWRLDATVLLGAAGLFAAHKQEPPGNAGASGRE